MNSYLSLLLLAISSSSLADDSIYVKYGGGVFHSAEPTSTVVKTASLGVQTPLVGDLVQQVELGLWTDNSGISGRTGSSYISWAAGIEINPGYLDIIPFAGVAGITSPDNMLSSHFQFNEQLFVGVKDNKKSFAGINYTHISCANLCSPNLGRDLLSLKVGVTF